MKIAINLPQETLDKLERKKGDSCEMGEFLSAILAKIARELDCGVEPKVPTSLNLFPEEFDEAAGKGMALESPAEAFCS